MSIVKLKNKRSGVTYVYESESYWDKEKKQPRSKRILIGKLDEGNWRDSSHQKKRPDEGWHSEETYHRSGKSPCPEG